MNHNKLVIKIFTVIVLMFLFIGTIYIMNKPSANTCVKTLETIWISNIDAISLCDNTEL